MEMQTIITLLTITVMLLSIVMIVLLGAVIAILFKLQTTLRQIEIILQNVATASEWVAPAKAINQIVKLFRR